MSARLTSERKRFKCDTTETKGIDSWCTLAAKEWGKLPY